MPAASPPIPVLRTKDWFHADGFPIAMQYREPQGEFGYHAHEFSELVLITGGTGLHVTGTVQMPLAAGDVFVISGRRPHVYQQMRRLRLINVLFDPRRLAMPLGDLTALPGYHALFTVEPAWRRRHEFRSRLHLSARDLGHAVGLCDRMNDELKARAPGFGFVTTALYMQLVGFVSRCYGATTNPDGKAVLRVAQAISHLEANYAQPVTLEDLAEIAGLTVRSFTRAFGAAMGCSPIQHLIQLRVNRAAALLRQTDESVTDIAFRVGFQDGNYFTRQFHKLIGMTPRQYRRAAAGRG
ncbi:MAG TPA: helix-turn-helix domain-containing protein [Humisphaera sp.]